MKHILLILLLLLTPLHVMAQEEAPAEAEAQTEEQAQEEPEKEVSEELTYSPDYCEFSVTFPDAPYTSRRCEDEEKTRCYEQISYTQVYELSATVNFRIICNPVDESLYEDYSAQVMEATLRAMTKDSVVKEFNSAFREEDGFKQAGLVGEGKVGRMPMIYLAQLWIGKHSALSIEAELIGEAHDTADKLFSDILKTIHYSGVKELEPPKKTPQPEKD